MAGPAGSTFAESFSAVRTLLDDPSPVNPTPRVILEHYKAEAQLLLNQAQNSSVSWSVRSFTLTTQPDKEKYQVTAQDFSKDVLIHTLDESDPHHVERRIERVSLQSRMTEYTGPKKIASAPNYHTAELFVLYWENGVPFFDVRPVPAGSVKYKVWYEIGLIGGGEIVLDTTPILPISHPYLHLRVARSCLPYADWPALSNNDKRDKKRDLALSFSESIRDQAEAFRRYIATDRQHGVVRRRGFEDDQYMDDYGGDLLNLHVP
jgi:hypothetical protein